MTFDREPDLDNANVGMPDTRILGIAEHTRKLPDRQLPFFVVLEVILMVKINGEEFHIGGMTLAEYLASTGHDPKRIAVERNGEIVPRARYGETVLTDGDRVEVVSFVGGG